MSVAERVSPVDSVHVAAPRDKVRPVRRSQGLFCIWHGLELPNLLRFLRQRPPMHPSRLLRIASLPITAVSNSLAGAIERTLFGRKLKQLAIEHPPVFVLGHWRSGTTLLHNLLTLDPQFTYPNLYQVLFPGHFLWTERAVAGLTAPLVPKQRPMDNMPAGWGLPQEDEMALCTLTLISPYMMLAFQNDRPRYERFFEVQQLPPAERERWQQALLTFLKKLTLRCNKPIVLKSPTHTYRIPILLEMFPQARFVYIYRNPYAVFQSTMHLRRTLFRENSLTRLERTKLAEDTLVTYEHLYAAYSQARRIVPPGQLAEVRFEDLEADPLGQMQTIYEQLHLDGWEQAARQIRRELPALKSYRKNSYRLDAATMREIYERWRPAFEEYGYSPEPD